MSTDTGKTGKHQIFWKCAGKTGKWYAFLNYDVGKAGKSKIIKVYFIILGFYARQKCISLFSE